MSTALAVAFFVMLCWLFVQFARQEQVQDEYEDVILDVEGRLDWARTRSSVPLGMQSHLESADELLGTAKHLWSMNRWHRAYRVVLQSQEAMNKAQRIYSLALTSRQRVTPPSSNSTLPA